MSRIALAVLALALVVPEVALAQDAAASSAVASEPRESGATLAEPPPGVPPRRRRRRRRAPEAAEQPAERFEWDGPRVELGWARYAIADAWGGGTVDTATFGGFVPTGAVRLGGYAELGVREYTLAADDAVFRGTLLGGYQHLGGDLVPYACLAGSLGLVVGKRFHTPQSRVIAGLGLEAGLDLRLVKTLFVGASLSYQRATMNDLAYDLFTLRLRIGL